MYKHTFFFQNVIVFFFTSAKWQKNHIEYIFLWRTLENCVWDKKLYISWFYKKFHVCPQNSCLYFVIMCLCSECKKLPFEQKFHVQCSMTPVAQHKFHLCPHLFLNLVLNIFIRLQIQLSNGQIFLFFLK